MQPSKRWKKMKARQEEKKPLVLDEKSAGHYDTGAYRPEQGHPGYKFFPNKERT